MRAIFTVDESSIYEPLMRTYLRKVDYTPEEVAGINERALVKLRESGKIVNKAGKELAYNEYNSGISAIDWLIRTSYTDMLNKIAIQIVEVIKPGGGSFGKCGNIITVQAGEIGTDDVKAYLAGIKEMIATLDGILMEGQRINVTEEIIDNGSYTAEAMPGLLEGAS